MLSQRSHQMAQPVYDYYLVEADLDIAVDDQPIDFSKRYSDVESNRKLVGKKRPLSTISVNSEPTGCKQPCEDDLRVYCIEGTPLLISSSSSVNDLRDVGTSEDIAEKERVKEKCNFKPKTTSALEKQVESPKKQESVVIEDKTLSKEDEVSDVIGNEKSRVSSPLMFSRSSSVCSLNSFEQHSIVDDRSSVSIFSNLTSGIISPSEIPDSPGEVMSPFVHKNKQPEFKFPVCDSEKESLVKTKVNIDEMCIENYDNIPEDDVKVYNVEDCSSMSSFSELSIHTSSRMSVANSLDNKKYVNIEQKTSIQINYVTNATIVKESQIDCLKANEENCLGNLISPSIESTISSQLVEEAFVYKEAETNNTSTIEKEVLCSVDEKNFSDLAICFQKSDATIDKKENLNLEKILDSCDSFSENDEEADAFLEECIRSGKPIESLNPDQGNEQITSDSETYNCNAVESCNSLSESDDEADALLEECIRNGKPCKISVVTEENKKFKSNIPINQHKEYSGSEVPQIRHSKGFAAEKTPKIVKCQKQCLSEQLIKKTAKVFNSSSPRSSKQIFTNTLSSSKQKEGLFQRNKQMSHIPFNNLSQARRCRFLQNTHSYGMKPFRELPHNRATDPVKKLQKELLIGVYQTLREEKTRKNVNSFKCDDDDVLLNQYIQLGMPDKKNKSPFQSLTHSPSKSNQVYLQSRVYDQHIPRSRTSDMHAQHRFRQTSPQLRTNYLYSRPKNTCCPSLSVEQLPSQRYHTPSQSYPQCVYDFAKDNSKHLRESKKEKFYKIRNVSEEEENIIQEFIRLGMSTKTPKPDTNLRQLEQTKHGNKNLRKYLGYRDNQPDGVSADEEEDDDDELLIECINAGKPISKPERKNIQVPPTQKKWSFEQQTQPLANCLNSDSEEAPCIYKTEDTPVLSPSASISDLSSLSFNDEKNGLRSNLNNSRNSDCSSDSDDDELLLQCIQSGMPSAKRAVA